MEKLLYDRGILVHPFVVGEIALGRLRKRAEWLDRLARLPRAVVADVSEVLFLIERQSLFGSGIGYVDAHLVTSALLTSRSRLWTRDKKLRAVAERLSVAAMNLD